VPRLDASFWTMVAVVSVGALIVLGGGVAQLVAWVGALVNSYQLQDKMWFLLTLILGLVGFEPIVMIAYLVAAPDGYEQKGAGGRLPGRRAWRRPAEGPAPGDGRRTTPVAPSGSGRDRRGRRSRPAPDHRPWYRARA